jgi:hypothetical protein
VYNMEKYHKLGSSSAPSALALALATVFATH